MTILMIGIGCGILISVATFVATWEETHKGEELYRRYNHD